MLYSFSCCTLGFIREGKRAGLPEEKLTGLVLDYGGGHGWFATIVCLLELPVYISDPVSILIFAAVKLSFHGGLVFSIAIGLWYTKSTNCLKIITTWWRRIWRWYALVRIGCLFNGCCYGSLNVFGPSGSICGRYTASTQLTFLAALLIFLLCIRKKGPFCHHSFIELFYLAFINSGRVFREVSTHTGILL